MHQEFLARLAWELVQVPLLPLPLALEVGYRMHILLLECRPHQREQLFRLQEQQGMVLLHHLSNHDLLLTYFEAKLLELKRV